MDRIVVRTRKATYECYVSAEQDKFEKADEINTKLKWIREIVNGICFSTGSHLVEYDICCYDSKEIDAFAAKIAGNRYVIAISAMLLTGMDTELENYFRNPDLKKYFWGNKGNAKKHAQKVCEYILMYVVLHEYYHILNGHLDAPYAIGTFMAEGATNIDRESNRYIQILECDADYCAVRSCMYLIFDGYQDLNERISELRFLGFSLYFVFLKFQESGYENMHHIVDLYAMDHPVASIRFVYAFMVMVYGIMSEMDEASAYKEVSSIAEVGIYFDRVYYDADTFDLSLSALAYTERGMKHLDDLHTGWNKVRSKLKSASYVELKKNEPVDFAALAWVDKDGNIIQSKYYENVFKYLSGR